MMRYFVLLSLLIHATVAQNLPGKPTKDAAQHGEPDAPQKGPPQLPPRKWPTLSGKPPMVIARGGLSGLFPEGSAPALGIAKTLSLPDMAVLCNLQLTKDGIGFCLTNIKLDNTTNIKDIFPKGQKTYNVNGQETHGWFSVDYSVDQMFNVSLAQNIYSRPNAFDFNFPVPTMEDVAGANPSTFWLSVPYDQFYSERKINALSFVEKAVRLMHIHIVSCPEVDFMKRLSAKVNKSRMKLIFQFLGANEVEPTTRKTYGDLLKDLATVKSFASGIMVPKEYIVPINSDRYLGAPTTLVDDAHKQGLEVYAYGFANDNLPSYNYSNDPSSEYLQFIGSPDFSVDGVITDFPNTASESIACFAEIKNSTRPKQGRSLIISSNGASGVYPGSTDLAYQQAVTDGADIIDCSVQMTKDKVAFCMSSPDLTGDTTAMTAFMSRTSTVPEIQENSGIFSFDLTWSEIQTLKPTLISPYQKSGFIRNPANKNNGKFVTIAEFLELAKAKAVSGVLINIQNAAYLASKKGLDIIGAVSTALTNATFDKQPSQQVLIQSDDTAVLDKFKTVPTYRRVFFLEKKIGSVPKQLAYEIKKHADAINVARTSIIKVDNSFTTGVTDVVKDLKAANISVYVHLLKNEFVTLPFDYYADPLLEIATYTEGIKVDGIVTEFPATAAKYMRSECSDVDNPAVPFPILPINPGDLFGSLPQGSVSPAQAPNPPVETADVVHPPLPPVSPSAESASAPAPASSPSHSGAFVKVANLGVTMVAILVLSVLSLGH